jgi:hypothetical protein
MPTNVNVPYFADPPQNYDRSYLSQITRAFALFAQQVQNPGEGRNTYTVYTNLQQNDYGLEVGTVYRQGNVLYVTLLDTTAPAGVYATASGRHSHGGNNMNDTVITMQDGGQWAPATSKDIIHCSSCENAVDTPEEVASYPNGNCPDCGNPWTGAEGKGISISVTAPAPLGGGVF